MASSPSSNSSLYITNTMRITQMMGIKAIANVSSD
jgi:hypothetical protein